jgi:hypothetical protein
MDSRVESLKTLHQDSRAVNSREDRNRPSEGDRWQRSRDLVNLEVRKVRAQILGAPSHEW